MLVCRDSLSVFFSSKLDLELHLVKKNERHTHIHTQLKSSATQNDSQSLKKKSRRSSLSSSSLCIYIYMYVSLDHLALMDYTKYNMDTHLWFERMHWFCLSTSDRGCSTRNQCQMMQKKRYINECIVIHHFSEYDIPVRFYLNLTELKSIFLFILLWQILKEKMVKHSNRNDL